MKIICFIAFLLLSNIANAADGYKYKKGDCITPTNQTYSWFGKNARIEAVSKIKGYEGINYILSFPESISNSVIFSKEIEKHTKNINESECNL